MNKPMKLVLFIGQPGGLSWSHLCSGAGSWLRGQQPFVLPVSWKDRPSTSFAKNYAVSSQTLLAWASSLPFLIYFLLTITKSFSVELKKNWASILSLSLSGIFQIQEGRQACSCSERARNSRRMPYQK
jgi:hypothetical protein